MMYYIGIDGGGTKTAALLCDEQGNQLCEAIEGATNPTTVSTETIEIRFQRLLDQLRGSPNINFLHVKTIFVGMSGYSRLTNEDRIIKIFREATSTKTVITISHDAITALYSGTNGNPGIVNIAGTGSLTFGVNEKGEEKRVGGWGFLLDHSGSGYGIGLAALKRLFHESDDGLPLTPLSSLILKHFGVIEPKNLIPLIYDKERSRENIASLAPLILDEATRGNVEANELVDQASADIAESVKTLTPQLFGEGYQAPVSVVLVGGLMKRKELFLQRLKERWDTDWQVAEDEPVVGAVIAAKKEADGDHGLSDFATRLKRG
ncbi:hypothetical protein LGQ02_19745 [Bacillus shivajii]|uniref:N-acetylglucosamine kinase n=1 Tax=Bacillus shivajii TaxID=1983719 RepID=UPI001CFB6613|nr:BadF/BadG/BcrA/BcrD ATPase family protein [Bacillus shivajii]UCZ52986.1 hypothetical protein LGQ02_19745 [Bacillus shivajii]